MVITERTRGAFLILYILFGFFWGLGNAPLFDEDEGFFAEGTREMVLRQDFVSSFVNQEQRFDKPPLTNWLQYFSTKIFGWNEFAMRFPSAVAAVIWMLVLYLFTRKHVGEREAFFATLICASSLQITIIGKAALADSLLNASLTAAMFALYLGLTHDNRKYIWLFYFFTAIGFLTKGPVAVLIPGAVCLLFLAKWKNFKPLLKIFDPIGLLIFTGFAAPWYWLEYQAAGMDFVDGFFLGHNVNRFQTAFEGHYGGVWYFVPVLILGLLPFTAVIFKSLVKLRYLWSDKLFSFLLIWFAFVFILFSLSGTKLHHYIIYGYSPLCVAGGWYVAKEKRIPLAWPACALLLTLTVAPFYIPFIIPQIKDAYAVEVLLGIPDVFDVKYYLVMAVLMAVLLVIWVKTSMVTEVRMALVGLVSLITVNIMWMPRLGELLQSPVKEAALVAREMKLERITVLDHYNPSFYFYSGIFANEQNPQAGDIVFTKKANLSKYIIEDTHFEKYGMVLVKVGAQRSK